MRLGRTLATAALFTAILAGSASPADDAPLPTPEALKEHEGAGRMEEAIAGWATRALTHPDIVGRRQALQSYIEVATKKPALPDLMLEDSVARSGAGLKIVAGRRVVLVMLAEALGGADPAKLAAMLDATELAVERVVGVKPPPAVLAKDDKRPRDRNGRFIIGMATLPKPAAEAVYEGWIGVPDAKNRGYALVAQVAYQVAYHAIVAATNKRARLLQPAVNTVVCDVVVRELAEPVSIGLADEARNHVKERYEREWVPNCLSAESMGSDGPFTWLFFQGLEAERANKREPADALRAFFTEPRKEIGGRNDVATARDIALEPLAATMCPAFCDILRKAGALPVGRGYDEMKARVRAEEICGEAREQMANNDRDTAASTFRIAADSISGSIAADALIVEALDIEDKDDPKKARARLKALGLAEGFEFLGPLPDGGPQGDATFAQRLMPLVVATAPSRHSFKWKDPDISLKWEDVKDVKEVGATSIVPHTPWSDKRGRSWSDTAIAAMKWKADIGRMVRLRPCRSLWSASDVVVLADGRPCETWPDGSVLVPGAKGTEIVLASASWIRCAVPWREAKTVEDDLAAAAADKQPILALRPWAARRVAMALPQITAALTALPDDAIVREMRLLAPFRGGDAATCDAMLARARGKTPVLAAYLDVCRGTRDVAVLDRIVGLATAPGADADTVTRVQYVLDGVLFRKVVEKPADLPALWERTKKWIATAGFAEVEEMRDLLYPGGCFRVVPDTTAWGRSCMAPTGNPNPRGEGYLSMDIPEGTGNAWMLVRWQPVGSGRLTLKGTVSDGKRVKTFSIDMSPPLKPEWGTDIFDIGNIPRGHVVVALDDPCASGCKIDSIAIGGKPVE